MSKKYDVVAKVGEYTDQSGQIKPRWKNVGAVITTENGFALLLDATFNHAALAEPGRQSVLLNLFDPKSKEGQQQSQPPAQQQSAPPADDFDDQDIPF